MGGMYHRLRKAVPPQTGQHGLAHALPQGPFLLALPHWSQPNQSALLLVKPPAACGQDLQWLELPNTGTVQPSEWELLGGCLPGAPGLWRGGVAHCTPGAPGLGVSALGSGWGRGMGGARLQVRSARD